MPDPESQGRTNARTSVRRDIRVPLRQDGYRVLVAGFEVDQHELLTNHRQQLDELATILKNCSNVSILGLEGRASETGPSPDWNMILSSRRAHEVRRFLQRRQIHLNMNQVVALGQDDPLQNATGSGPGGREIAANRSVMILLKHPPLAVARASPTRTINYFVGSTMHDVRITLDGSESRGQGRVVRSQGRNSPATENIRIVSYLWEQIEANNNEQVYLNPPHTSTHHDTNPPWTMRSSDHAVVSFVLDEEQISNIFRPLKFRLTVTDENQLTDTDTLTITINRHYLRRTSPPPRPQWGLRMAGSVSMNVIGPSLLRIGRGPFKSSGVEAGIGGMVALGQLKFGDRIRIICFTGLGGGFSGALRLRSLRERQNVPDISIDNPMDNFESFTCDYTDFGVFDGAAAVIRNAGASIFFVGGSEGQLNFLGLDTDPEWIDVGGGEFVNSTALVGAEAKGNMGLIWIIPTNDFINSLGEKAEEIFRLFGLGSVRPWSRLSQ